MFYRHEISRRACAAGLVIASALAATACGSGDDEVERSLLTEESEIDLDAEAERLRQLQAITLRAEVYDESSGEWVEEDPVIVEPSGSHGFIDIPAQFANPVMTPEMSEFLSLTCGFPVACQTGSNGFTPTFETCYVGPPLLWTNLSSCGALESTLRHLDVNRKSDVERSFCSINALMDIAEERADDLKFERLDGIRAVAPPLQAAQRPQVYYLAFQIAMRQMLNISTYLGSDWSDSANLDCSISTNLMPFDPQNPSAGYHPPRVYLASRFMKLYHLAKEAAEGFIQNTVQVADAQYGTTLSPDLERHRVFFGSSLSRVAAASFIIGSETHSGHIDQPLPTTLGLPPLDAAGLRAERLLRTTAPPLSLLGDGSGPSDPDAVFGVNGSAPGSDTILARLETLLPVPEGWASNQSFASLDTSRSGVLAATEKLRRLAEIYDTPADLYEDVDGLRRYAATSIETPERPDDFWLNKLNPGARPPSLQTILNADRLPGLAQLELLVEDTLATIRSIDVTDDVDSTLASHPQRNAYLERGSQLLTLAAEDPHEVIRLVRSLSTTPGGSYTPTQSRLIFVPSTNTRDMLCATEGRVDHIPCPDGFDWRAAATEGRIAVGFIQSDGQYRYYHHTFAGTGWSSGVDYYLLRPRPNCVDGCSSIDAGEWELVGLVHNTPNSAGVNFRDGVAVEVNRRAGRLLAPDPDRRNRPLVECAAGEDGTGVFDRRIPLENSLNSDGDPTESSWSSYLIKARDAALEADSLGQEYLRASETVSRDTIDQADRARAREVASRSALEAVYEICGEEDDVRLEITSALEEGRAPELDCLNPSVGTTVALGDSNLCFCSAFDCPRPTNNPDTDCSEAGDVYVDQTLGFFATSTFDPPRGACDHLRRVRDSRDTSELDFNLLAHALQPDLVKNRVTNLRFEALPGGYVRVESGGTLLASTNPTDDTWPCVEPAFVDCDDEAIESFYCQNTIDCDANPFADGNGGIALANSRLFRLVMNVANMTGGDPTVVVPFRSWSGMDPLSEPGEILTMASGRTLLRRRSDEESYYWTNDGQGPENLFVWTNLDGQPYVYRTIDLADASFSASSGFFRWDFSEVVNNGLDQGARRLRPDAQAIPLEMFRRSDLMNLLGLRASVEHYGTSYYASDWYREHNSGNDEWPLGAPHDPSTTFYSPDALKTLDPESICTPSNLCDGDNRSIWDAREVTVRDQLDALELSCMVSSSEESCGNGPPIVRSARDLHRLGDYFKCQGRVLENQASRLAFEEVPSNILESGQNAQGVTTSEQGLLAQTYSEARQQLQQFAMHSLEVGRVVRQAGVSVSDIDSYLKVADIEDQIADLRLEASTAQNINNCVQAIAGAVQAGANTSIARPGSFVAAGAAATAATASCATARTLIRVGEEIDDLEDVARGVQIADQITKFNARMGDLSDELGQLALRIAVSVEGFKSALGRSESLRARARRHFEDAEWHLSSASEEDGLLSAYLENRSRSARRQYTRALQRAKNISFLAKNAVEQRLGVRLANMNEDLPLVEAPSKWESKLCALSAIDYSKLQEASSQEADELLGELFVGQYVRRLENVVESYRLRFPFREGQDSVSVSIRDEIQGVRQECEGQSANLLLSSERFRNATAARSTSGPWTYECPPFDPQDPDAPWPEPCVTFGDAASELPSGLEDVVGVGATPVASEVPVTQIVTLDPGTYRLSWYEIGDSDPVIQVDDSLDPESRLWTDLPIAEQNFELVHSPGGIEWRRAWTVFDVGSRSDVRVGIVVPPNGGGTYAAPMLERVSDLVQFALSQPRPYVQSDDRQSAYLATCPDVGGTAFRATQWQRGCEYLCPTGFAGSCGKSDAEQYCYYETSFVIPQVEQARGQFASAGFARGNFNYRIESLGLNIVGTGLRSCGASESPESCYAAGFVPFSVYQEGPFSILDYEGNRAGLQLYDGRVEQGRALASERYLTNPLSTDDASLINQYLRTELAGMPLDGRFRVRLWDAPGFDFQQIEDVQLVLNYRYWTRSLDL